MFWKYMRYATVQKNLWHYVLEISEIFYCTVKNLWHYVLEIFEIFYCKNWLNYALKIF